MSEAARSRRDDRQEPRMGSPVSNGSTDPLAELARLVGQDDPFRNVFRSASFRSASPQDAAADAANRGGDRAGPYDWDREPHHGAADHRAEPDHDGSDWPIESTHHEDAHWQAVSHDAAGDASVDNQHYYADEMAAYPDEAGIAEERLQPHHATATALPDLWAAGETAEIDHASDFDHGGAMPELRSGDRSSGRRPLLVLAAVLLLTGGGLGATFLAKGAPAAGTVVAGRSAPTIMAATGPTKVKLDDGSDTAPEDKDAALLNKNGNSASGPVKVVSSQEQPVDLGQLPKAGDLAEGARPLPPASPSPFPEPKKVKTFLVHPNGTMLSDNGASAPIASGPSALSKVDPTQAPTTIAEAAAAPLPATPKTVTKGGITPKSIASLSADPVPTPDPAARQPASPGVHAPAKPTDDTTDSTPTAARGGAFGLQLAASPSESEAHAAFAKLKKKYPSQLGSYVANVHKSETGDKPVYRVRVGGMSQDEAKSLCSQLQSSGGSCFVVHN